MRRLTPSTLRQRVAAPVRNLPLIAAPARTLQTSSKILMPRTSSTRRTFVAPSSSMLDCHSSVEPPTEPLNAVEEFGEGDVPAAGPSRPTDDLSTRAFELIRPEPSSSTLPSDLRPASTHLNTNFLPGNQHLAEESTPSPFTQVISFEGGRPRTELAGEDEGPNSHENSRHEEHVVALASPFEGGDGYISTAASRLASELDADVVRIDLALALGLDGAASPLGQIALGSPALPSSLNPLFRPAPSPLPSLPRRGASEPEELEEGGDMPGMAFTSMPIAVLSGGGGGMPSMGGMPQPDVFAHGAANEDWISFFSRLINVDTSGTGRRRIVLLESTIAMSRTFPIWWSSLVEAVRKRRIGQFESRRPRRPSKVPKPPAPAPILQHPTSIVFSCTPSLLLSHTAPSFHATSEDLHEHEEEGSEDSHADPAQAIVAALEEKFKSMGVHVQHHVEVVKSRSHAKLWWGSEERDGSGRTEGDQTRLDAMYKKGVNSTLPTFGQPSPSGPAQPPSNPLQRLLLNRFKPPTRSEETDEASSLVWKAFAIVPQHRNTQAENDSRVIRRRILSAALISRAVSQLGGTLVDPLQILQTSEATGKQLTRKTKSSSISNDWGNAVVSWQDALHIASIAVGTVARDDAANVHWQDIVRARKVASEDQKESSEQLKRFIQTPPKAELKTGDQSKDASSNLSDPVVEKLKKAKNLSQHEKRLLPCIVDTSKLASTSFKDVHLPDKTVDAIRSMVSLPLLFPEAFRGGVLKDHATSGALLFGPPGTGKTLLARAIASESGARMLAIQPSDVNDMYIGEGEKLVKAVFSLARRLSPCVVFLDEVDALFGARISRGSAGSMSHNLLLTEFMQEMDGLSSAIANKDKRVVVIGATNRPFDLDDAVLRRLPRRLLVDLPSVEGRKAILEILLRGEKLGDDVDLDRIAKDTDGFSGSDLKHLCVSAALSAVKDSIHVPWAKDFSAPTPSAFSSNTTSTTTHSPRGGGGGMHDLLVVAPSDGSKGRRKPKVVKHKAEATPTPIAGALMNSPDPKDAANVDERGSSAGESEEPGVYVSPKTPSDTGAEGENSLKDDTLLSANKERETTSDSTPSSLNEESSEHVPPKQRILLAKHFKVAQEEIRPSASEEGSLPELRKWAEQFGEGGTRKGKKSGFGKGFGFGEIPAQDQEGYGRVKTNEQE